MLMSQIMPIIFGKPQPKPQAAQPRKPQFRTMTAEQLLQKCGDASFVERANRGDIQFYTDTFTRYRILDIYIHDTKLTVDAVYDGNERRFHLPGNARLLVKIIR